MAVTAQDIKQLLNDRGWTQKDLTERMGLSSGTINHWFSGRRNPSGYYERELERLIAETAVMKAQDLPDAGGEELRNMIHRIVASTTPADNEATDPITRAYRQGRREVAAELLDAIVERLLVTADRVPTLPEAKEPTLPPIHGDALERARRRKQQENRPQ